MYKLVLCFALVAFVTASPQFRARPYRPQNTSPPRPYQPGPGAEIAILRQTSDISPEGSYSFSYETANGISADESAQIRATGPESADKQVQGSFAFTSLEGVPIQVTYTADENGFQAQGAHLPTAPPIPEAILRSLQWNAQHPEEEQEDYRQTAKRGRY